MKKNFFHVNSFLKLMLLSHLVVRKKNTFNRGVIRERYAKLSMDKRCYYTTYLTKRIVKLNNINFSILIENVEKHE